VFSKNWGKFGIFEKHSYFKFSYLNMQFFEKKIPLFCHFSFLKIWPFWTANCPICRFNFFGPGNPALDENGCDKRHLGERTFFIIFAFVKVDNEMSSPEELRWSERWKLDDKLQKKIFFYSTSAVNFINKRPFVRKMRE